MEQSEKKYIAFDFDGVLFDSEWLNFLATKQTLALYGFRLSKQEYVDCWILRNKIREGEKNAVGYARLKGREIDYGEFREKRKPFWEKLYEENLKMLPGAREAVELFPTLGFSQCIVSHNFPKNIKQALEKFELSKCFEFIISHEDIKNYKPHPEPYALAAQKFNTPPQNIIAIEDSPLGVESAKKAGLKCIAVPNQITSKCDFSKADLVLNSLEKLNQETIRKVTK